ncbi:MAG: heparinase II/III family protein [Planctomycetes bacterium]|nr:heparinase II/III family protein [Planctomycetota bacterium]
MRWPVASLVSLAALIAAPSGEGGERLLTGRFTREDLRAKLLPAAAWKPFPAAADRAAWEGLRDHPLGRAREAYLAGEAEAIAGTPWPPLPATLYMGYARNGNREAYQTPYFERRRRLAVLVLAECFEHRGRFLDEIANGIWAICEESTWCLPAHASRPPGAALHRLDGETIDLFACETAMTLATARYLLRPELDGVCPVLCDRIAREVEGRIVGRFLALLAAERPPGWTNGRNNWGPWCASNTLGAAMLLVDDPARLAEIAEALMAVADRFIDGYGDDGGCDEGPSYWGEAGGALVILLELLHSRSGGAIDIYDRPKIAAMGEFIARARLDGDWFANFADADARQIPHPGKVYRFGERVGSEAMRDLALLAMRRFRPAGPVDPPLRVDGVCQPILGPLMEIFWIPPDASPRNLPRERDVWYPDLQVLFARESTRPGEGLVLAAKGGHNAESHNHDDVGHFIVFLDGRPGIIDLGRETYTRQTFSDGRYELLFTRGLGHNAPVVNGIEQAPGRGRRATAVEVRRDAAGATLSMRLEEAYPEAAGLASLRREIALARGADPCVRIRDTFEVREGPARILVPMFAAAKVDRVGPGRLSIACGPRPLILEFEPSAFEVRIETVPIADRLLRESWGDALVRIAFSLEAPRRSGAYGFRFRAAEPSKR